MYMLASPITASRRGIERHGLLVFVLRLCELILFLEQRSRRNMRFWILRLQGCRLSIGRDGLVRFSGFQYMPQRKPRPRLALRDVACRFELRRRPQKLLGIGLATLGELKPEIQIRLKHVRLSRHRFPIGGNRLVQLAQAVLRKPKIEPCHIIRRIIVHHFAQQWLGPEHNLCFWNQVFGLGEFRRRAYFLSEPWCDGFQTSAPILR